MSKNFKKRQTRQKPGWQIGIARERIRILFEEAEKRFDERPELSHRYVEIARKISMKYTLPIPAKYKRRFCKKCHKFLRPGKNSKVRLNPKEKMIHIVCLECGNVMRVGYAAGNAKN